MVALDWQERGQAQAGPESDVRRLVRGDRSDPNVDSRCPGWGFAVCQEQLAWPDPQIDYPWDKAAELALQNGRPEVHHALLTGLVMTS